MRGMKKEKTSVLLVPQLVTHGATATANLDCKGAGDAEITVTLGAMAGAGTAPSSIKLYESDDTVVTNFSEITALSTGAAAVDQNQSVRFFADRSNGARKRYLRVAITVPSGSTNSNITLAAVGRLDMNQEDASSTSEYGSNVVKEV